MNLKNTNKILNYLIGKKIKSINTKTKIFLILLIIFYSVFLFYLAEKTSVEFDETTHSLLAVFYKDLI
ncbi:MAG: hypothetical protein QW472_02870, partial [Candidatus Aenigmatarchaeota archaeon]